MILTSSMAVHVRTIKSRSSMGFGKASAGYIRSSLFWKQILLKSRRQYSPAWNDSGKGFGRKVIKAKIKL